MPLNTAGDLIAFALRAANINGVGQTPMPEDSNDGLILLNAMLGQWQANRWVVPDLVNLAVVATGAASYSVGPSGAFAITRPNRVESAFARLLVPISTTPLDYPLTIIDAREDYDRLSLKSLSTLPAAVFYDSAWPTGTAYIWPVAPSGQYELHLTFRAALPNYASLVTPLALPVEYTDALIYGLAMRLRLNYGRPADPGLLMAYRAALSTIRMANLQMRTLQPADALGQGAGGPRTAAGFLGGLW